MKQYLAFRRKPVRIGNELTLFYTVYLSIATMKLYICVLYKQVHTLQWRVMVVEATCILWKTLGKTFTVTMSTLV